MALNTRRGFIHKQNMGPNTPIIPTHKERVGTNTRRVRTHKEGVRINTRRVRTHKEGVGINTRRVRTNKEGVGTNTRRVDTNKEGVGINNQRVRTHEEGVGTNKEPGGIKNVDKNALHLGANEVLLHLPLNNMRDMNYWQYGMILFLFASTALFSQPADSTKSWVVGVKAAPPFIIQEGDAWSGVCIDLWEKIAAKKGIDFEYRPYELAGLLEALKNKSVDISINPLTVTSERVASMDFTQPFYISNLAIAYKVNAQKSWLSIIKNLFSYQFFSAVALLFLVITIFGLLLWLAERKRNPEQFSSGIKGFGEGIWWSAVTMTTVGYGDKSPVSFAGRLIAVIWMFTAIIIISGLTAGIASALTITQLESSIQSIEDLRRAKVATVANSSSAAFLSGKNISFEAMGKPAELMEALENDEVDAVFYDAPILQYLVKNKGLQGDVGLIQAANSKEYYSFALPKDSEHTKAITLELVKEIERVEWMNTLKAYGLSSN